MAALGVSYRRLLYGRFRGRAIEERMTRSQKIARQPRIGSRDPRRWAQLPLRVEHQ